MNTCDFMWVAGNKDLWVAGENINGVVPQSKGLVWQGQRRWQAWGCLSHTPLTTPLLHTPRPEERPATKGPSSHGHCH